MKFDMHVTSHIKTDRPEDVRRACWDAVEFGARMINRLAKQKAPVKTGALRDSIAHERTAKGYRIGPSVNYAPYVEFGTQAHWIFPKNARVLHWVGSDGKHHFATKVHHPGTRQQPYMRPSLDEAKGPIMQYLHTVIKKALR